MEQFGCLQIKQRWFGDSGSFRLGRDLRHRYPWCLGRELGMKSGGDG